MEIGSKLGHYEIIEHIGAGGMGEVYRARDTKLGRDVAIKSLPADFAENAERLARFEREAKMLASLNHPNIAAIYGLEESEGVRFIVLELAAGDTLEQRLRPGPLTVRNALEVCRRIAEGLEAAHGEGIIHRDLKPSNVKVTSDRKVKVLDFGLAKAFGPESPGTEDGSVAAESPTITVEGTRTGVIMGTAAYMSPEQARGRALDGRTDIWSFGCVLYEALTGRRAFEGDTVSDTLVSILEREPDWSALPDGVPRKVLDLLRRCLQRDLHRRLHHIADARIEIEEAIAEPEEAAARVPGSRVERRMSLPILAIVAVASVLVGLLVGQLTIRPAEMVTESPAALGQVIRLTYDPRLSEWPTWSPDGSSLAFASNRSGDFEIYVRRVEGGQEVNITQDPGDDFQPAFSPDGEWVAFVSTRTSTTSTVKIGATFGLEFRTYGGDVWVAPALGGRPRRLARNSNFPIWHPDGDRIAYVSGRENHRAITEVRVEDVAQKPVLLDEASAWEIVRIRYSPDGSWISFDTVNPDRVLLMPAAGGEPRELLSGLSHVWDPSGERIYYLVRDPSGGTRLQFVDIDPENGSVEGTPRTLGLMTGLLRDLAISSDGRSFAASELEGSLNMTRLPLSADGSTPAGPEEELSSGRVIDRYPTYSPEGRRIALASDRLGREEIWILDLETRGLERLQLPGEDEGANLAYWTPDGEELVISRMHADGNRSLWLAAVDGSHSEELIPRQPGMQGSPFSPDGRELLYTRRVGETLQLFVMDVESRQSRQLTDTPGDKFSGVWSPDGGWIVFMSNASGYIQLWRIRSSGGEEERLTQGNDRIRHAFFSPDGRWLYFQPNHQNIFRIPAAGGDPQPVTTFPESGLFLEEPAISPDGRSLVYCRSNGGSTLWILEIEEDRQDAQ